MTDYRCSACGTSSPSRHYDSPCIGDPVYRRLPLSPAVRLLVAPVTDKAVQGAFAGRGEP